MYVYHIDASKLVLVPHPILDLMITKEFVMMPSESLSINVHPSGNEEVDMHKKRTIQHKENIFPFGNT